MLKIVLAEVFGWQELIRDLLDVWAQKWAIRAYAKRLRPCSLV
jgi:hypothetical protein